MRHRPPSSLLILIFYAPTLSLLAQPTCKALETRYDGVPLPDRPQEPESPLYVCRPHAGVTCCSRDLESVMRKRADEALRTHLQDRVLLLRKELDTQLQWLQAHYQRAVLEVERQLDDMFKRTYGPFYEANSQMFADFFAKLRLYGQPGSKINLDWVVEETFDKLYQVVFSLLNPLHFIGTNEWRCMKESMQNVSPFGDRPDFVSQHLSKALPVWRQFLTTIEETHKILHSFLQANVSHECSLGFTRATRCSVCDATIVDVKPCAHYCLNVLKGCLGDWADVNEYWGTLLGTMSRAMDKLKNARNVHFALSPLPVQFSEAIMYFQEKGTTITNMVLSKCFNMTKGGINDSRTRRRVPWMRRTISPAEGNWKVLSQLLTSFSRKLKSTNDWWRRLPYEFCYGEKWATPHGDDVCWNGETVGSYPHEIVGDGSANQKNNPEFQKALFLGYRGHFVEERLRLATVERQLSLYLDPERERDGSGVPIDDDNEPDDDDEGSGDLVFEDPGRSGLEILPTYTRATTKHDRIWIEPSAVFRIDTLSSLLLFMSILLSVSRV